MFCRLLFVFSGVRVPQSLVVSVMFCRLLFVFSGVRGVFKHFLHIERWGLGGRVVKVVDLRPQA
jgi:hypothetical protein